MKVLIIEDEKELLESICQFLGHENYVCETASDVRTALDKIAGYEYSCIVLDLNLPDGNGLTVLKELIKEGKTDGVLIISARNSVDDKVLALKSGADDYLSKPFHLPELSARVAAIIRRKFFEGRNILRFNELELDLNAQTVKVNSQDVELTRKEYELLLFLASNKRRVVAKNAIAEHLWGDSMESIGDYDFIYTHIKNLRRKLAEANCPDYIKSIYGVGYKFNID